MDIATQEYPFIRSRKWKQDGGSSVNKTGCSSATGIYRIDAGRNRAAPNRALQIRASPLFLCLALAVAIHAIAPCAAARIRHDDVTRRSRDIVATSSSSEAQSHDVVAAARCRVRCLAELKKTATPSLLDLDNEDSVISLMNCLRQSECTACLKPCSQPAASSSQCSEICDTPGEERICQDSCRFLHGIRSNHPGSCPAGDRESSRECSRPCGTDQDCGDPMLRCCHRPCGRACVRAQPSNDLPPVPGTPSLREKLRGGSIELRWNAVSNSSIPLLYIVDSRWNIGQRHSEADMTPWQQVAQTSGTSAVVNDFTPGHWYQFRVSSVNINGASHPSVPTHAFKLSKEPQRPSPPTNLTEGDTLIMGSKRAVTLHWFPPAKSDLPVTRYKLFWSKKTKQADAPSREYRQILPGDRLVYQIPNLESDTTYFVEVQAVCHYGEARLKSDKAGIYITTYPVPHLYDQYGQMSGVEEDSDDDDDDVEDDNGPNTKPVAVTDLMVDPPYYQDGILKSNVSWVLLPDGDGKNPEKIVVRWSPEACIADNSLADDLSKSLTYTAQGNWFAIFNLRSDCRYLIKVEPISVSGSVGVSSELSLTTPSCGHAPIIGDVKPDCLNNVPRVPDEPQDVEHSFIISSSNMTSRITWSSPASSLPITGYRIVWGRLLNAHHHNPTMDKSTAITKVLPKDVRTLNIGDLVEGTTYLVRVQALSRIGAGKIASIQFTTPLLQLKPVDPPYMDVDTSRDFRRSESSRRKLEPLLPYFEVSATSVSDHRHVIRESSTLNWQPAKWSAVSAASRSCHYLGHVHLFLFLILSIVIFQSTGHNSILNITRHSCISRLQR